MTNHAPKTRWIVTDLPLYAFRVGLPVPPHLVVASTKRFVTGALTEEDLMNFVREYNPEQVLTGNGVYPNLETFWKRLSSLCLRQGAAIPEEDLKGNMNNQKQSNPFYASRSNFAIAASGLALLFLP
jgi:hypothetical protein